MRLTVGTAHIDRVEEQHFEVPLTFLTDDTEHRRLGAGANMTKLA